MARSRAGAKGRRPERPLSRKPMTPAVRARSTSASSVWLVSSTTGQSAASPARRWTPSPSGRPAAPHERCPATSGESWRAYPCSGGTPPQISPPAAQIGCAVPSAIARDRHDRHPHACCCGGSWSSHGRHYGKGSASPVDASFFFLIQDLAWSRSGSRAQRCGIAGRRAQNRGTGGNSRNRDRQSGMASGTNEPSGHDTSGLIP